MMNGRAFKMHFGRNIEQQKERRRQAWTDTCTAEEKGQTAETNSNRVSCKLTWSLAAITLSSKILNFVLVVQFQAIYYKVKGAVLVKHKMVNCIKKLFLEQSLPKCSKEVIVTKGNWCCTVDQQWGFHLPSDRQVRVFLWDLRTAQEKTTVRTVSQGWKISWDQASWGVAKLQGSKKSVMSVVDPACGLLSCWHVLGREDDVKSCTRTAELVYSGLQHNNLFLLI